MRRAIALLTAAVCAACTGDTPPRRPAPSSTPVTTTNRPAPPSDAPAAVRAAVRAEAMLAAERTEDAARAAREGLEAMAEITVEGETARARMARVLAATGAVEEAQIHAGRALVKLERLEEGTVIPPLRTAIAAAMGAVGQEALAEKIASRLAPSDWTRAWTSAAEALRIRGATDLAASATARAAAPPPESPTPAPPAPTPAAPAANTGAPSPAAPAPTPSPAPPAPRAD